MCTKVCTVQIWVYIKRRATEGRKINSPWHQSVAEDRRRWVREAEIGLVGGKRGRDGIGTRRVQGYLLPSSIKMKTNRRQQFHSWQYRTVNQLTHETTRHNHQENRRGKAVRLDNPLESPGAQQWRKRKWKQAVVQAGACDGAAARQQLWKLELRECVDYPNRYNYRPRVSFVIFNEPSDRWVCLESPSGR